jgi:hypothetical protein
MRTLVLGAGLLLSGTFLSTGANAQVTPVCPTFQGTQSSGCGATINITATGAPVTPVAGVGPYDGSDDTLIGVVNNIPKCPSGTISSGCGINIFSIDLSSTTDICGFDGDGINNYGAPGNSKDTTGYGGPQAYFTPIPPATTINPNQCRVNFDPPLKPGDSTYFSLENVLNTANISPCTKILNNSVPKPPGNGTSITATFTPQGIDPNTNKPYTLAAAAAACGFLAFDWQQTITNLPTPLPGNLFNDIATNKPPPATPPGSFNDPPPSGYKYMQDPTYAATYGLDAPQISVYWDPFNASQSVGTKGSFRLADHMTPAGPGATQLQFFDLPMDPCLPGPQDTKTTAGADAACGPLPPGGGPHSNRAPAGSTINFTTRLVGIKGPAPLSAATASVIDTGIFFSWTSNYNGTSGGIAVLGNIAPTDPGSGSGGVTVTGYNGTSTYSGVGVTAINGSNNIFGPTQLLTAVLPASRSVQVNGTATAFATIINTGTNTATGCSIAPASGLPLTFAYRTTNPATNAVTGTLNTPVDIPAGASQSFVIGLTPGAAIAPIDLGFNFSCTNTTPAPIVVGLNTLLFSASTTPTPDIIALAATIQNDGIVHVSGSPATGVFAIATSNLGAGDSITVSADTGGATLPVTITMCQTNPQTGQCLQTRAPTVTATIASNTTPTFGIFVDASGAVPFDPANSRIFVKFKDSGNAVRGETSVAVTSQ